MSSVCAILGAKPGVLYKYPFMPSEKRNILEHPKTLILGLSLLSASVLILASEGEPLVWSLIMLPCAG